MITEEIYIQVAMHVIFDPLMLITKTTTYVIMNMQKH